MNCHPAGRQGRIWLWIAIALGGAGCSGATTQMGFDHLEYPVSMSPVLRTQDRERPLHLEQRFREVRRAYGTAYGLVRIDPETELSEMLNQAVEDAGGDGIVNLQVRATGCTVNYVFPLHLLPVWPTCVHLEVSGDVVSERDGSAPLVRREPARPLGSLAP